MKVVVCGRRWGKTTLGLLATVDGHGGGAGAVDRAKVWWVAPDYPTAAEIWRDLKRATAQAWTDKSEIERRIEFPGGGSITVKSAHDPTSLVAAGLDGLVIDEAGKVPEEAWDFLRPTLADRQGWCIMIGTPRGFNWFHDKFEHAGHAAGWARWQQPSSANPLMTAAELAQAREDAPRLYGQEYEARFEQPEGAEWPPEYFPASIWFSDWPREPVLSVLACDPSLGRGEKKKGCYAAICYAALDSGGKLHCEAWMSQGWDGGQLAEKIVEKYQQYRPNSVLFEANGGQEFLGFLLKSQARERAVGLPLESVTHAGTITKEERIRAALTARLRRGELRFRDTHGTHIMVNQCREFPVGEFVDGPDVLAMASDHVQRLLGRGKPGNEQRRRT